MIGKKSLTPVLLLLLLVTAGSCHSNNRKEYRERAPMSGNRYSYGLKQSMKMRRMPMLMDSIDMMPFGLGKRIEESIPNVTELQKKQINDLMKKHQEDMKKLHEEIAVKMKSIMASHRQDILNVLTKEQKNYLGNPEE